MSSSWTLALLLILFFGAPAVQAASFSHHGLPKQLQGTVPESDKRWILIGEKDDRGSLLELGPKLGMSKEEIEQARASTGYVYCNSRGISVVKRHGVSGFLALSNQVVVTAGHVFWGKPDLTKLECFFQNQQNEYQTEQLDFASGAYY